MSAPTLNRELRRRLARAYGIDPRDLASLRNTAPTPTAIPDTAEALEEAIGNPETVAALMRDGRFKDFVETYANKVLSKDPKIVDQVKVETERVLASWLKDNQTDLVKRLNLGPDTPLAATSARSALYNRHAPGAKIDREVFTSGDSDADVQNFFKNIYFRNHTPEAQAYQSKLMQMQNAFGSQVPADGGFLIPETLRAELLRVALETAIVRPRARVVPMETLRVPFPSVDSTSNASSVYGGVVSFWTEEAGQLQASQAKFGRVILEAKKLTAYSEVPNELFNDALMGLMVFINQIFPEAIAFEEDFKFMLGTGVGEPRGFVNSSAVATVLKESGQAASTIKWENIVKMFSRMLPTSLNRAVWIASIDTFPALATMSLTLGTGGSAIWLNNGQSGPPMTILGRPVIFTEKLPSLGTTGDISFVDLGYYLIGDRQMIQASTSVDYKFQNDQTAIRFIERVDGTPWLQNAITPKNGGAPLSPFVQVENR